MNVTMRSLSHQRGIVALWAVIFLIVGVMLTLTQVYDIAGSRGVATAQQSDSTAAFFIAESGLQSAGSRIRYAGNPYTECTGTTPATLGGGSFSYTLALAPTGCNAASTTCACQITSTGTLNAGSRTVRQNAKIIPGSTGGTSCGLNCQNLSSVTWSINGKNISGYPAVAVIHLAAGRQGNPSGSSCPGPTSPDSANCTGSIKWLAQSINGDNSVLSEGHAWELANGASTGKLWMQLNANQPSKDDPVAIHGMIYPGTTATPKFIGAYWYGKNGETIGSAAGGSVTFDGQTSNGTATTDPASCNSPISTSPTYDPAAAPAIKQNCTSWCYGGDRLVYAAAVWPKASNGTTATLSAIAFNGIALIKDIHFPDTTVPGAQTLVYSEFWSKYNAYYLYGARTTGSIALGQPGVSGFTASASGTILTVSAAGTGTLYLGDTIAGTGVPANTRITALGTGTGGAGTYTITSATFASTTISSTRPVLTITAVESGTVVAGQALYSSGTGSNVPAGTTIAAHFGSGTAGGAGTYYLNMTATPLAVLSRTIIAGATSSGSTISVPNEASMPAEGTILAIRSGTGSFSSTEHVRVKSGSISNTTSTFQVETLTGTLVNPTTAGTTLAGAQICGGTCAFFDHVNAMTPFSLTKPDKQDYFSSGFSCISGGDGTPQAISVGTTIQLENWNEIVK